MWMDCLSGRVAPRRRGTKTESCRDDRRKQEVNEWPGCQFQTVEPLQLYPCPSFRTSEGRGCFSAGWDAQQLATLLYFPKNVAEESVQRRNTGRSAGEVRKKKSLGVWWMRERDERRPEGPGVLASSSYIVTLFQGDAPECVCPCELHHSRETERIPAIPLFTSSYFLKGTIGFQHWVKCPPVVNDTLIKSWQPYCPVNNSLIIINQKHIFIINLNMQVNIQLLTLPIWNAVICLFCTISGWNWWHSLLISVCTCTVCVYKQASLIGAHLARHTPGSYWWSGFSTAKQQIHSGCECVRAN